MKLVLGLINDGKNYLGQGLLSSHLAINALRSNLDGELSVRVCTKNPSDEFSSFVKQIHSNTSFITPYDWETLNIPDMRGMNFSTYWKFDLINSLSPDEFLFYLDADAFLVNDPLIDSLVKKISIARELFQQSTLNPNTILMVPAHRPVFERVGYQLNSNPFHYFNAGFFFGNFSSGISPQDIQRYLRVFYFREKSDRGNFNLIWHDQDLINTIYSQDIFALPLRYNVATGLTKTKNFKSFNGNTQNEILNAVIIHASGKIIRRRVKWYPRKLILSECLHFIKTYPDLSHVQHVAIAALRRDLTKLTIPNFMTRILSRFKQILMRRISRRF